MEQKGKLNIKLYTKSTGDIKCWHDCYTLDLIIFNVLSAKKKFFTTALRLSSPKTQIIHCFCYISILLKFNGTNISPC